MPPWSRSTSTFAMFLPASSTARGAGRPPTRRAWRACASTARPCGSRSTQTRRSTLRYIRFGPSRRRPAASTAIAVRVLELHRDAVPLADLLEQRVRLGRQAAGVQREHADLGVDPPRHVDQRHAVDAPGGADRHARVEPIERPLEQLLRRGVLEAIGRGVDRLDLFVDVRAGPARGSVPVRSRRLSPTPVTVSSNRRSQTSSAIRPRRRAAGPARRRTGSRTARRAACSSRSLRPAPRTARAARRRARSRTRRTIVRVPRCCR